MAQLLKSSIGKKIVMSLTGLFLILFLTIHMAVNLISVFSLPLYDAASHFMGTNPVIKLMVPVLALGFAVHIAFAFVLSWQNRKARGGIHYEIKNATKVSWASKNMLALGMIVLGVLAIHLSHFWANMQLQEWLGHDSIHASTLVVKVFSNPVNVLIYILWILALTFHLTHGFWSAFHSMGLNNSTWSRRLKIISHTYVGLLAIGFLTPVLYFYIQSLLA